MSSVLIQLSRAWQISEIFRRNHKTQICSHKTIQTKAFPQGVQTEAYYQAGRYRHDQHYQNGH